MYKNHYWFKVTYNVYMCYIIHVTCLLMYKMYLKQTFEIEEYRFD